MTPRTKLDRIDGKTPRQWVANHDRMKDPPPCTYGHFGGSCSTEEGGPCCDEMLGKCEPEGLVYG